MRSFAGPVAAAVLGLAASGAATLVGDRTTFVPPPEARVEAFLRQLMTERAELAMKYLSRDLRARMSPAALQQGFDAVEQRIGEIENVTAQTLSWDRQSASARAELVASKRATMTVEFGLTWESGAWAIHDLPQALTATRTVLHLSPARPTCRSPEAFASARPAFVRASARIAEAPPARRRRATMPDPPDPTGPEVFRTAQAVVRPASSMNGST
jgi:hypothetical protein